MKGKKVLKQEKSTLRASLIRLICAFLLLGVAALLFWLQRNDTKLQSEGYDSKTIPPTCTDSGYTLFTNRESGETYIDNVVPALGHSFDAWVMSDSGDTFRAGVRSRTCATCAFVHEEAVYPEYAVPVLTIDGVLDGIAKKNEVPVDAQFSGTDMEFTSFASLKYQGHESLQYDKKNYTLKFWSDKDRAQKNKMVFSHWNKENKYILKANYIDPSCCRNLVCADVWAQVTASRDKTPEMFEDLSNYGAVDGFPIALYINRQLQGIYTMNLHKDDDLFGMSDGEEHAIVIANYADKPDASFHALSAFDDISAWEVEYCGTEDSTWAKNKFNDFAAFVINSDDDTFRKELEKYLDIDSAVDYLLGIYTLGLTNHGASDLVLVCYSSDEPWTASMYDMETAFGLGKDGTATVAPELFLPALQDGIWTSNTDNLLWDRFLTGFYPELCARYTQLRKDIFAPENLKKMVTDYTDAIDQTLYRANTQLSPDLPTAEESIKQILDYIDRRSALLDGMFLLKEGPNS